MAANRGLAIHTPTLGNCADEEDEQRMQHPKICIQYVFGATTKGAEVINAVGKNGVRREGTCISNIGFVPSRLTPFFPTALITSAATKVERHPRCIYKATIALSIGVVVRKTQQF
jgi:hypothetical protein